MAVGAAWLGPILTMPQASTLVLLILLATLAALHFTEWFALFLMGPDWHALL